MSEPYTVGIDVSMDCLDVAIRPGGQRFFVANDAAGWAELVARLQRCIIAALGLEPSGGYERGVVRALLAAGLSARRINPNKLRQFARARGVLGGLPFQPGAASLSPPAPRRRQEAKGRHRRRHAQDDRRPQCHAARWHRLGRPHHRSAHRASHMTSPAPVGRAGSRPQPRGGRGRYAPALRRHER
jgi:transposase